MNYDKYENFNEDYNSQMIKYKLLLESKSQIARMGEIVVSSKEKPIVGTTALATCFGIVFYDIPESVYAYAEIHKGELVFFIACDYTSRKFYWRNIDTTAIEEFKNKCIINNKRNICCKNSKR